MHFDNRFLQCGGVALLMIFCYWLAIQASYRAQRRRRRQEYENLLISICLSESNAHLCQLCLQVDEFHKRNYDEHPREVGDYVRLLKNAIGKRIEALEA